MFHEEYKDAIDEYDKYLYMYVLEPVCILESLTLIWVWGIFPEPEAEVGIFIWKPKTKL